MKAPYFTVLIDSYNYGEYVEEAVSSVLAQDFPTEEHEILAVDDGSTNDTQERLWKFGEAICNMQKPNGGPASAFNFGFERARGGVLALLDADDVWMPDKLERVYEEFQRHPAAGMVYHRVHLWNGVGDISEDTYFIPVSGRVTRNRRALLQYPMVGTSCLTFRREALQKLLPVRESLRFQADAYVTVLIIFVAKVAAVPEYLGKYRLPGANLFRTNAEPVPRDQTEQNGHASSASRGNPGLATKAWRGCGLSRNSRYLKQWVKAQEGDGFALKAPGRWKFFGHLLDFPRTYGEIMARRHRVYSYIRAFAALFLGYHHLYVLDDMRAKRKALFAAPLEKRATVKKEKVLAARG
jgi:glycosyltransferase involved in cell wall biosynthesis